MREQTFWVNFPCKHHMTSSFSNSRGVQVHPLAPPAGAHVGQLPPRNLKKMTSYALSVQNTLKLLYKTSKNREFSCAPSARRKIRPFLLVSQALPPPLEEFLRAPMDATFAAMVDFLNGQPQAPPFFFFG